MARKDDELDRITTAIMAGAEHAIDTALARFTGQLGRTLNGLKISGARYHPIVANGSTVVSGTACRLYGFMLNETTGTACATICLYDGTSTDDQLIGTITLNPGESTRDVFGPAGVSCTRGVYLAVAGSVAGSVLTTEATV